MPKISNQQRQFLDAYLATMRVCVAAKQVGLAFTDHAGWLRTSANYRKAFRLAQDEITQRLEDEAIRRAVNHRIDDDTRTIEGSDELLKMLLLAFNPQKYGEQIVLEQAAVKDSQ